MIKFEEIIKNIDSEASYTLMEVSKIVGMSYSCILAHVKRGNFKATKVFSRFYIKGIDLKNYLLDRKDTK